MEPSELQAFWGAAGCAVRLTGEIVHVECSYHAMGAPRVNVGLLAGRARLLITSGELREPSRVENTRMPQTPIVYLDHITVNVRDLAAARRFYAAGLGALGMHVNCEDEDALAMGSKDEKVFWLAHDPDAAGRGHYAFRVEHQEEVDAFYAAALAAGGTDNGKPGLRPAYGPNYYAAFVKDREGNNIEVVCYAAARSGTRPEKERRRS